MPHYHIRYNPSRSEIYASVAEWSNAADCKSAGRVLRGFESLPAHKEKPVRALFFVRREESKFLCFRGIRTGGGMYERSEEAEPRPTDVTKTRAIAKFLVTNSEFRSGAESFNL